MTEGSRSEDPKDDGDENDPSLPLRRRWATVGLATINVTVFLALVMAGVSPILAAPADLIAAGGVDPGRIWQGEIWRLLSACFVHIGIWHLAMNVWVLWIVGTALERMIGGPRVLLLYLTAGVFGFALSSSVTGAMSVGASGAVFGLVGALLGVALLERDAVLGRALFSALMPFVVATFVLGFLVPGVDNAAHLGGLLFGFALGYGLSRNDDTSSDARANVWWDLTVLAGCALIFAVVVIYAGRPLLSPRYHAVAGVRAVLDKKVDVAKRHAQDAARLGPEDASTFLLLARIKLETSTTDAERAEARRMARVGMMKLVDDKDVQDAFEAAVTHVSILGTDPDLPYADVRMVALLCEGALEEVAASDSKIAPILKNQCAWTKLKARDPAVHDPQGALALARAAVDESEGRDATIVHTLAEALAQTGDPKEGLAHLEKLAATHVGGLPSGFLDEERRRLARLVAAQAPAGTGGPDQDAAPKDRVGSP